MENKISNYVTEFRKSHGTYHFLVIMLQGWEQAIDKGKYISVIYMGSFQGFWYYKSRSSFSKSKRQWFFNKCVKLII